MKRADEIRKQALSLLKPDREAAKVIAATFKNQGDYERIFRFTTEQLENLAIITANRGTVIAQFQIESNTFELVVECKRLLGAWGCLIMARCLNNQALNISTGGGTSLAYAVTDQWHKKIMDYLRS